MEYTKTLIDTDGEEFPFSESFDEEGYFYKISVIWDGRDGELNILNSGCHMEFDDDGSWLDFQVAPENIFPGKKRLDKSELLQLIHILETGSAQPKVYTRNEMDLYYEKYLELKNRR